MSREEENEKALSKEEENRDEAKARPSDEKKVEQDQAETGSVTKSEEETASMQSIGGQGKNAETVKSGESQDNPSSSVAKPGANREDAPNPVPRAPRAAAAGKARPSAGARPRPAAKGEKKPVEPSPLQHVLDRFVKLIEEKLGNTVIEEAYINRPSGHLPTLVVSREHWLPLAELLKEEPKLSFDYLRNLAGVDYQTHIEVVYQFYSFQHDHHIAVRVKTDREESKVPSVAQLWKAADWNEREAYDLLGIHFENHPNLKRILMPDDWVGHPLRKDYEPLDKEV